MENVVLKEVMKELSWKERIVVKIFPNTVYKIYSLAGKNVFNNIFSK